MAFFNDLKTRTFEAGVAMATPYIFVVQAADGQVDPIGSEGVRADGVLLTTAAAVGDEVTVAYDGRVKVLAAGTISRGAAVKSDNAGKAVAATTGDIILGYAEEAAVDTQIITVRLSRAETASA